MYEPVEVASSQSSYNLKPRPELDPELFENGRMVPGVRSELLSILYGFIDQRVMGRPYWLRAWLAGSAASYRWYTGGDTNADLDILLGVDGVEFRRANPDLQLGDAEIADYLNSEFKSWLWPATNNWRGKYEVTWYVNPRSMDIRILKPYAAYDLIADVWTVSPSQESPSNPDDWAQRAESYGRSAISMIDQYNAALAELGLSYNSPAQSTAMSKVRFAAKAASDMFDTVHSFRGQAFTPAGSGLEDFSNYLWQQGKAAGWLPALRAIKKAHEDNGPTPEELLRMAIWGSR